MREGVLRLGGPGVGLDHGAQDDGRFEAVPCVVLFPADVEVLLLESVHVLLSKVPLHPDRGVRGLEGDVELLVMAVVEAQALLGIQAHRQVEEL